MMGIEDETDEGVANTIGTGLVKAEVVHEERSMILIGMAVDTMTGEDPPVIIEVGTPHDMSEAMTEGQAGMMTIDVAVITEGTTMKDLTVVVLISQ